MRIKIKQIMQVLITCLLLSNLPVKAGEAQYQTLIMGRSLEAFPETMSVLQETIKRSGYKVSVVQRVDVGLQGMGYKTDKYRVVFFGKTNEIKNLPLQYPELTPYLPLAIAIFAEDQETILTAMSPLYLTTSYENQDPDMHKILMRWDNDIRKIIHQVCKED